MPNTLQIKRGLQASLPTGSAGELLFTTDTKRLYISDGSATNLLQGASTLLTTGAIPFSDANGKLSMNASNFYWDNTNNRLGIGTASPLNTLDVAGTVRLLSGGSYLTLNNATFSELAYTANNYFRANGASAITNGPQIQFLVGGSERMRVAPTTGNVLIGTTTDAGYKLDVNGTARVSGNFTIDATSTIISARYQAQSLFNFATTFLYGAGGQTAPAVTSGSRTIFLSDANWVQSSGTADFSSFRITGTINQTGTATGITRGLYINPTLTAAADFRAIEVASGITILGASTTAKASLRIPSGTAPTTPVNGDIWFDGTNIKMQIGGVTKTFTLI